MSMRINGDMINLCIVEDEQIIRRSISEYFNAIAGYHMQGAYESVEEFHEQSKLLSQLDVLLLDINLPGLSGIDAIPSIKTSWPNLDIIILTTFNDPEHIFSALENGAVAYILKKSPIWDIKKAIDVVNAGGSFMTPEIGRMVVESFNKPSRTEIFDTLTDRQSEILGGITDGLSYKMIASKFGISEYTANDHIKAIYKKLQVNSKAEAISLVLKSK